MNNFLVYTCHIALKDNLENFVIVTQLLNHIEPFYSLLAAYLLHWTEMLALPRLYSAIELGN